MLSTVLLVTGVAASVEAAELGRRSGADIPKTIQAGDVMAQGVWGVDIDLGWNSIMLNGPSGSSTDQAWLPQVSAHRRLGRYVDGRIAAKYLTFEYGAEREHLFRTGIGARGWLPTGTDFTPYGGLLANYYAAVGGQGMFGVSAQAGVAYAFAETFWCRAGLHGETLVAPVTAEIGGSMEKLSVAALGVEVGVTFVF